MRKKIGIAAALIVASAFGTVACSENSNITAADLRPAEPVYGIGWFGSGNLVGSIENPADSGMMAADSTGAAEAGGGWFGSGN